jgi:hypothetical protein
MSGSPAGRSGLRPWSYLGHETPPERTRALADGMRERQGLALTAAGLALGLAGSVARRP